MKQFLFTVVLLGFISCGEEAFNEPLPAGQLLEQLETAYEYSSTDDLDRFFADWNRTVRPNPEDLFLQNGTIKSIIFDIYKEIYNPLDSRKLNGFNSNLNSVSKYVVVQDKMFYQILLDDNFENVSHWNWDGQVDSIVNFRPTVNLSSSKVLYLTEEYEKALRGFLGSGSIEVGEDGIINPPMPDSENMKRYGFLRQYIPILHKYWVGVWLLETRPYIERIILNKKLNKARVDFRVNDSGGEATLLKVGNNWKIADSKATWIE